MSQCTWREGCGLAKHKHYQLCQKHLGIAKSIKQTAMRERAEIAEARRQEAAFFLEEAETSSKAVGDSADAGWLLENVQAVVTVSPANSSFAYQAVKFDGWQRVTGAIEKELGQGQASIQQAFEYAEALKRNGITARAFARVGQS